MEIKMGKRTKQFRSAMLLAGAITILWGHDADAAGRKPSPPLKYILVLGDSLSDGVDVKRSQAYPALLVNKLRAAGLHYELTNASAIGGTAEDGLRRLPPHLKRKIDIFIVQLGINDLFLGTPIEEIRQSLQAIIDRVKAHSPGVRIVICGMQLPDSTPDDHIGEFGQMYADLASRNRGALVPYLLQGVGGEPLLNLPDHIHPNAAGHRILADNVWRVLEPIAREVSEK